MFILLNRLSIAKKMVLIFIGSVLIPVVFQYFFFYIRVESNLEAEIENRLYVTLENKAQTIDGNIQGLNTLARKYNQSIILSQIFNTNYEKDRDYYQQYNELKKMIVADLPYHSQLKQITFITDNPTIFNGGYVTASTEANILYDGETLINKYIEGDNDLTYQISVITKRQDGITEKNISLIKEMDDFVDYSEYQQLLRIDLNRKYLGSLLSEVGLFERLLVLDEENNILFESLEENAYTVEFQKFSESSLPEGYSVYYKEIEGLPFTLCGLYNSDTIISQFEEYRTSNLWISFVSVLFAAVFISIIAGNIQRRMNKVVHLSEKIAEGNFIQLEVLEHGEDEFSELEDSMNLMSKQLAQLIDNEYKSEIAKMKLEKEREKAKFFALQSQVNPHFLFNALESIRLKALVNSKKDTANMIKSMAKMFRNIINWETDLITVEEEVKFLHEFLSIQKYRFEDDFSYKIDVEEGLESKLIPKMIIQPLVENACVHGSSVLEGCLHVDIEVSRLPKHIKIRVSDNGSGMSKVRLREIRKNMADESYSKNVGLYNVYQRLKLFCGNRDGLLLHSEEGRGTICEVLIPKN